MAFCMNKASEYREDSPRDHNSCNPTFCGPLLNEDAARNFEYHVSDEKYSGTKTNDIVGEAKTRFHSAWCSKSDVDPVKVCNDVKHEEVRHQPLCNSSPAPVTDCAVFDVSCTHSFRRLVGVV